MDTLVSVGLVVESQCRENAQFDATSIAVFLNRPDYLDRTFCSLFLVECLDDFSESSLTEEFYDIIWETSVNCGFEVRVYDIHRSVNGTLGLTM